MVFDLLKKLVHRFQRTTEYFLVLLFCGKIKKNFNIRYINLSFRTDRRVFILNQIKKFKLNISRIEAVYLTSITTDKLYSDLISKQGINEYLNTDYHKDRTNGVIGCYLSHLKAILNTDIHSDKIELYLEDDARITSIRFFLKIINHIKKLPSDWDICIVDPQGKDLNQDKINDFIYYSHGTYPDVWGMHAVLVNPLKVNHITTTLSKYPIRDIDGLLTKNETEIQSYILKTGYCFPMDSPSDITKISKEELNKFRFESFYELNTPLY